MVFWRADERTRTADLLITSELLYLLSYVGLVKGEYTAAKSPFHSPNRKQSEP
jgi:hypothetical protein